MTNERFGELLVTGALYAGLTTVPGIKVDLVYDNDGIAQPELMVSFDFMQSHYRLKLTQEPATEVGGGQLG